MESNLQLFESLNLDRARLSLQNQGFFLIENAFDESFCQDVVQFIDSYSTSNDTEINYAGSELRIWDSHQKSALLGHFFQACNQSLPTLLKSQVKPKTLLAIRNKAIDSKASQLQLGRWHLDSFFNQIKIFLFLSNTSEQSGPFEFIPRSHRFPFKLGMLCKGKYIKPMDLLKRKRGYAAFEDSFIDHLSNEGYPAKAVLCSAGTLMVVNTSAIHRARPCLQGSRYALTAYYL